MSSKQEIRHEQVVDFTMAGAHPFVIHIFHGNSPSKKRPFLAGLELLRFDFDANETELITSEFVFVGAFKNRIFAKAAARDRAELLINGPIYVDDYLALLPVPEGYVAEAA